MKIISRQSLVCSALALMLSVAVSSRDAAAAGAAGPEPGAGCQAANPKQICSVVHGAPYVAGAMIEYLAGSANFFSEDGAKQLGNSGCTMGPEISGGAEMSQDMFNSLTRRDIQGFCVTNASNECKGTELAEVLAVQKLDDGPKLDMYEIQVLLLPVVCEDPPQPNP